MPAALILLVAGLWFARRPRRTDLVRAGLTSGARLAAGHRPDVQLHGRHLPRLLHRRPGPRGRRPRRHRRGPAVARPRVATPPRSCWPARSRSPPRSRSSCWTAARTTCPGCKWVVAVLGFSAALMLVGVRHLPRRVGLGRRVGRPRRRARRPGGVLPHHRGHPAHRLDPDRGPEQRRRSRRDGRRAVGPGACRLRLSRAPPRRHGWRQCRRAARGQPSSAAITSAAADRRDLLHLGRGGGRVELRGRLPAGQRAAGDGDRRLQRQRPEPDPGAVQGLRRGGPDPLLHRQRRRWAAGCPPAARPAPRSPRWVEQQLHRDAPSTASPSTTCRPAPGERPAAESQPHGLPLVDPDAPVLDVVIPVHNEEVGLAAVRGPGAPAPEPAALVVPDHRRRQRQHRRHRAGRAPAVATSTTRCGRSSSRRRAAAGP